MKQYAWLVLLLLSSLPVFAAGGDEADANLFVVVVGMLLAFVSVTLVVLLIFALCAGIVFLLAGLGIVSISMFSAWYHRSFAKGISTFFRLSLVAMGLMASGLFLLVLNIFQVPLVSSTSFCVLVAGAGATAGWVCFYLIKRIGRVLIDRFVSRKAPYPPKRGNVE